LALGKEADDSALLLATVPPTWPQRRAALAVGTALVVAFGIAAPFAAGPLPQLYPVIPALLAICFFSDLITAILLYSQFSIILSPALLVLASGYLFTALIVVPVTLTYPGLFSATGLLGAGLQTAGWLYLTWHFVFPASVFVYAILKDAASPVTRISTRSAIGWSAVIVLGLVCAFVLLFTAGNDFVPQVELDEIHLAPLAFYLSMSLVLFCGIVFVVLWMRQRSVLDQWLLEQISLEFTHSPRA
jgi:hypothetical protein